MALLVAIGHPSSSQINSLMPNIASLVDEGAAAIAIGRYANEEHKNIAAQIFEAVGRVVFVKERLLDAVTGLSGSGPAYI